MEVLRKHIAPGSSLQSFSLCVWLCMKLFLYNKQRDVVSVLYL